jgi:hypothetical protein
VPGDVSVRADLTPPDLPTYRAAVFVIEIDSISVIGPSPRRARQHTHCRQVTSVSG